MLRSACLIALWCGLMLAGIAGPALLASPSVGDDRIRFTIRLALVCYALAIAILLTEDGSWPTTRLFLARWMWSLAVIAYLVHVGLAFHYYHHWSHADAYQRTEGPHQIRSRHLHFVPFQCGLDIRRPVLVGCSHAVCPTVPMDWRGLARLPGVHYFQRGGDIRPGQNSLVGPPALLC